MNLQQGTILQGGKYRIERFINSGGFGCTYEATHTMLEERVAIKEFFVKDFCNRDERTARVTVGTQSKKGLVNKLKKKFVDEAKVLYHIQHQGIVRVFDIFEENGTAYFVMDYIDGASLKEIVAREGALPEARAVRYIRQVAEALEFVHSKDRLHLDIKPGNIMVNSVGDAILIDFGASKQYDEVDGENTSTLLGKTPGYAPLEQMGNDVVKFMPATDIYALGATLYKLLTGVTPLSATLLASGEELEPLPNRISASTRRAIAAAMNVNKNKRPQSVDAFLELLGTKVAVKDRKNDEATVIEVGDNADVDVNVNKKKNKHENLEHPEGGSTSTLSSTLKKYLLPAVACIAVVLAIVFWPKGGDAPVKEERVEILPPSSRQNDTNRQQTTQQSQQPTPVKEEPAAPTTTPLYVTTTPSGAAVYVDGKKVGTTPIEDKEVARGSHKVKLSKEGYEDKTLTRTFGYTPVVINETLEQVQSSSSSVATTGIINGHEWVDLGLSVKWATCNVGASSPGDYGNHYAWGETTTKSSYVANNSRTYDSLILDMENSSYDAARAHWGASWRLPTMDEFRELIRNCTWNWTSQKGHYGYRVTGPNGKSIFLPAAGFRYGNSLLNLGENGGYWSATSDGNTSSKYLNFTKDSHYLTGDARYYGHNIRPVSK